MMVVVKRRHRVAAARFTAWLENKENRDKTHGEQFIAFDKIVDQAYKDENELKIEKRADKLLDRISRI